MVSLQATVHNIAGIHVRPSGVIIKSVAGYEGNIKVSAKGMEIDLKNIMGLIAMGLEKDDRVDIIVEGADEQETAAALKELFESNFDFPPRQ